MILAILLLTVTSFSFSSIVKYSAYGEKDVDRYQENKQNSDCEAGEDNNNSCNNISITRQGDSGSTDGSGNGGGNQVQVSKQNSDCEAGEDNNNSCNNFDLKEMISDRLKMLRQT
jgi:hypothetical protein